MRLMLHNRPNPNLLRARDFDCATPLQVRYWRFGGDEETHYTAHDWPWQFCVEAYRPVCEQYRECGKCKRDDKEWYKLLKDDATRL